MYSADTSDYIPKDDFEVVQVIHIGKFLKQI